MHTDAKCLTISVWQRDSTYVLLLQEHNHTVTSMLKPDTIALVDVENVDHGEPMTNRDLLIGIGAALYDLIESGTPLPMDL